MVLSLLKAAQCEREVKAKLQRPHIFLSIRRKLTSWTNALLKDLILQHIPPVRIPGNSFINFCRIGQKDL
jgi:hypothetical protein